MVYMILKGENAKRQKKKEYFIVVLSVLHCKICAWQRTKGMFNYALLESLRISNCF